MNILYNIPLFLTITRLITSSILPIFLVWLLPYGMPWNYILGLIFAMLGLTDFFDGLLARRYQQETMLGRLLDPVADKFLVFSTAIALVYLHKVTWSWAMLVIARDVLVMGLREISLTQGFSVPVAWSGKIKTVLQFTYLMIVILNPYKMYDQAPLLFIIQNGFLLASFVMTIYSAIVYCQDFYRKYSLSSRQ